MKKQLLVFLFSFLLIAPLCAQLGLSVYPLGKMVGLRTSGVSVVDSREPSHSGIFVTSYFELRGTMGFSAFNSNVSFSVQPELVHFFAIGGNYPVSLLTGIGVTYGFYSRDADYLGGMIPIALEYVPKGERFPSFSIKAETDLYYRHTSSLNSVTLRPLIGVNYFFNHRKPVKATPGGGTPSS